MEPGAAAAILESVKRICEERLVMNEPLWSAALSLRAQRKWLNIPAPQISNVQHTFPWISYSFKLK